MDPELKTKATDLTPQDLRETVCETVINDPNVQAALIPVDNNTAEVDLNAWAENMKRDRCWVDHPFIQLTANWLKRKIIVLTIYKEDGTNGSGKIEIEPNESNGSPLYMLNYDNIHFQSIMALQ